jgi:hypothetical protein
MFAPSSLVEVTVIHFGSPARVAAFEMSAASAMVAMTGPTAGIDQRVTLRGLAISRVDVTPGSPTDRTLVLGWCH